MGSLSRLAKIIVRSDNQEAQDPGSKLTLAC